MELVAIRVRNYRTVGTAEQTLRLDAGGTTIVGPNNSGKTNLLRAIQLFFTGHENAYGYDRQEDLTFGAGNARTSLVATFRGVDDVPDHIDAHIYRQYDELISRLGHTRTSSEFTLSLVFSASGIPTYQFFPNLKQPGDNASRVSFSRGQKRLVTDLLNMFSVHYVPSARSIADLYEELLVPFMISRVAAAIEPHLEEIQSELDSVASDLNSALDDAGLATIRSSFQLPGGSLKRLIHGFDFMVSDPESTTIFRKGQGIQSTTFLASLLWIAGEELKAGRSAIWLLEEPESYLHPELSRSALQLLNALGERALVVLTTHSLVFVPQDSRRVSGTAIGASGRTQVQQYRNYREATEALRSSLGIAFSDFFNLGLVNVLVEGPTDIECIDWVLSRISREVLELPLLRRADFLDFGGVKHLAGFLRANFVYVRKERVAVAVFDGDTAGTKERSDLQQYFGRVGVPFNANQEYVSVRDRFAIEGLFPDAWVIDLHAAEPAWFDEFSVDSMGDLEPYRVRSSNKRSVIGRLCSRADEAPLEDWATRWTHFLLAIEGALVHSERRLQRDALVPYRRPSESDGSVSGSLESGDGARFA